MPLPIISKNYHRDFSSLLTSLLMPNTSGILGIPKQTCRLVYLQCIAWKGICIWSYWHQQQRIGNATIIIIKKIQFFVAVYCCVCPYKYHSCVTVVWTMNITTEVLWLSRTINNFTVNYTNLIQMWPNIFNTAMQKLALQFYTFFTLKRQRAHIVLLYRIFYIFFFHENGLQYITDWNLESFLMNFRRNAKEKQIVCKDNVLSSTTCIFLGALHEMFCQ